MVDCDTDGEPILPWVAARAAERFGDRSALAAAAGWSVGYAGLDRASNEVAAAMSARGIGAGDVVALVLPSTPDYVTCYLAAAKLGAITAGVNPRLSASERATIVSAAGPVLAVTTAELAPGLPAATDVATISVGDSADSLAAGLREPGASPPPRLDPDTDRIICIVFTSGTTGEPKGAVFCERQLQAITARDLPGGWDSGGPMLASTQFAHVGFMTKLPWYLMAGGTIHLLDRWRAADALRIIAETQMSIVGGVAPQIALMLRDPHFDDHDLTAVQGIIAGAAPSPPALVEEARRRFDAPYSIRYSSTESGGVGTATSFEADDDEALSSVGRPRPGVDLDIRDEDDRPVADGQVGEIVLRSDTMMTGYWRQPDVSQEALAGGWLHTGDLGHIDGRGLLRLAGRKKEMFIRGGYNVYPLEVEAALLCHPAVRDVAVVPRPDDVMGEVGVAVVVPTSPDSPPSLEDLRDHGADHLAHHKLPEAIRLIDELPQTAMGKLDRRALTAVEAGD